MLGQPLQAIYLDGLLAFFRLSYWGGPAEESFVVLIGGHRLLGALLGDSLLPVLTACFDMVMKKVTTDGRLPPFDAGTLKR